jgi:hypothetical protein
VGGIDDTYDLCADFLDASIVALALTEAGAPERAFVSPGAPVFDCCPQLTVHGAQLAEEPTSPEGGALGYAKRVSSVASLYYAIVVTIIRCVATLDGDGNLPSVEDLEEAGRTVNQDVWALWNHLSKEIRTGALSDKCKGAWRDNITAIPQQGGCGGWTLQWRIPINGADLTPSS